MRVTFLATLLLTIGSCLADKMSWNPCDAGLTSFIPSSVTLTPDPPLIGSPATFEVTGEIGTEVTGGSVDMTVSFSGLPIYSQTFDICSKTACPVAPGPISIKLVEALPPIAPPGDYGLQIIARGADGAELTCVDVNFSLVLPSATGRGAADSVGAAQQRQARARAIGTARRLLA